MRVEQSLCVEVDLQLIIVGKVLTKNQILAVQIK
jgi:hypothetical protein